MCVNANKNTACFSAAEPMAVSKRSFRSFAAGRALNGLEIICEDGSRLLLSHKNYEKLVRAGARFTVMNKTRLLAVTVNPFSAKGSHYNKTEFYDAMCSGLGGRVPVLDVVSEFGCEAAE